MSTKFKDNVFEIFQDYMLNAYILPSPITEMWESLPLE